MEVEKPMSHSSSALPGPARAAWTSWLLCAALALAFAAPGAASAQDTRPSEIPYDPPGEIPQLSPK